MNDLEYRRRQLEQLQDEVVDIEDCPLHHPLINKIVKVVKEEIEHQKVYVYNPINKRGLLRYLTVKVAPAANTSSQVLDLLNRPVLDPLALIPASGGEQAFTDRPISYALEDARAQAVAVGFRWGLVR